VANAVTTEGEARLLDWHARYGGSLTRLAVSRAEPIGETHHLWRPLATVTQFAAVKSDAGDRPAIAPSR
jgi:precorrin-6Y C5,15-methyltransferase (decarboxylating)